MACSMLLLLLRCGGILIIVGLLLEGAGRACGRGCLALELRCATGVRCGMQLLVGGGCCSCVSAPLVAIVLLLNGGCAHICKQRSKRGA